METIVPTGKWVKLGSVAGDLRVERGATVEAKDAKILVTGRVVCEGDASFKGSLTADRLEASLGRVLVEGSLNVADTVRMDDAGLELSGNGSARAVNIDRDLKVGRNFRAETVEVGGRFIVGGQTIARSINIGGGFECKDRVEIGKALVAGSVSIDKEAVIQEVDVGGSVKLAGGELSGTAKVAEVLLSTRPLIFRAIAVGGSLLLTGVNKGGDIDVGGRVRVEGDLEFETLQVGGRTQITGFCRGGSAKVGGRLEVGRDLILSNSLKVGTRISVEGELRARSLELAGTLDANIALVDETARVGGMIDTREGMRAARIDTASNWEINGPLIGNVVSLGRNAEAEDIYAQEVRVEDGASARNIYAARVHIGNDCKITGIIEYTDFVEVGTRLVSREGMPRKVKQLPVFPQGGKPL